MHMLYVVVSLGINYILLFSLFEIINRFRYNRLIIRNKTQSYILKHRNTLFFKLLSNFKILPIQF